MKQENFDPRNYYRRYNWRSNLDFNLIPWDSSINFPSKVDFKFFIKGENGIFEVNLGIEKSLVSFYKKFLSYLVLKIFEYKVRELLALYS